MTKNYKIVHTGEGFFDCLFEDGTRKSADRYLRSVIRYTYFPNFRIPPNDWEITKKQLIEDYMPKVWANILVTKFKKEKRCLDL